MYGRESRQEDNFSSRMLGFDLAIGSRTFATMYSQQRGWVQSSVNEQRAPYVANLSTDDHRISREIDNESR